MTITNGGRPRGIVYTFYSFKGGAGRSMALANVAVLLAEWGHSVLAIDWDLEAPGLECFFSNLEPAVRDARSRTPGILDLVGVKENEARPDWHGCLIRIGQRNLSLIISGKNGETYTNRLHALDFNDLFQNHGLGSYIETLRNQWIEEFDFVLVDSRTGFTDIGGICTVHLADVLVLLLTTTDSSVDGALAVVKRAREAQERLPLDRERLLAVPVPARDESRTEYLRAGEWKREFARRLNDLYRDWLPSGVKTEDAIDLLRIPYVPYWSFGERLPAVEESTTDPSSLGHAYEILARLLAARLDWRAALLGEASAPPPSTRRSFDQEWLERHRSVAEKGFATSGLTGFFEVYHFSPDSSLSKAQGDLLTAARQAQVTNYGWPTGVVLDREDGRPRPLNDGIEAQIAQGSRRFTYWTLAKNGDFYSLMSLPEDRGGGTGGKLWFNVRIQRAAESVIHCRNLYATLGVEPGAHVEIGMRYRGLKGRILEPSPNTDRSIDEGKSIEDETAVPSVMFRLGDLDAKLPSIVKALCEPLFVLFDFATFNDRIYEEIVSDFLKGR